MGNRTWLFIAVLIAASSIEPAHAQSESKVWYVPWPEVQTITPPGGNPENEPSRPKRFVEVTNLNGDAVRVAMRAFNHRGELMPAYSFARFDVRSGTTMALNSGFWMQHAERLGATGEEPTFMLVVSTAPVLVRAGTFLLLRPVPRDCRTDNTCSGRIMEGNNRTSQIVVGWQHVGAGQVLLDAYPINCANAAENHFACTHRPPSLLDDVTDLTDGGVEPPDPGTGPQPPGGPVEPPVRDP